MTALSYRAGRVILEKEERRNWTVTVVDGTVVAVGAEAPRWSRVVNLGSIDLMPGLVDLHSDCWEDRARPRPTSELPLDAALVELDTEVVSHGITTHFVCVAIEDDTTAVRSPDRARFALSTMNATRPSLRADHRVHLRVEITGQAVEVARELAADPVVDIVSYMDHTPGQGQYATEAEWRDFYIREGRSGGDVDALLAKRRAGQAHAERTRAEISELARGTGTVLASHDDDTEAAVDRAARLGARIAEFPVTAEAAKAATAAGLAVVMGAPNARRGRSHLTNISAHDALNMGTLHVLASDYHPASLLAAVYALVDAGLCGWARAVALVTSGPAAAAGFEDRGVLAPGRRADMVAVARRAGHPSVVQTWVAGAPAFPSAAAPDPGRSRR